MNGGTAPQAADLNAAIRIVDDAWSELRRSPFVQRQLGLSLLCLPDVSYAEARRRSGVGSALLERLNAVDLSLVPHALALSLRAVRFKAQAWSKEADWYWTVTDPLGVGFFGMFLPTAYCGGLFLNILNSQLAAFRFDSPGDPERYLALATDYARLINQFAERTADQAVRGMRMPKVQVRQARVLLEGFKSRARDELGLAPKNRLYAGVPDFWVELDHRIKTQVEPAFDHAIEGLSDIYLAAAPEAVGLGQYPNGPAVYAELLKFHTTLDLTPADVHEIGLERMAAIQKQKSLIRREAGFSGDDGAFVAHIGQDPRWHVSTVQGVSETFDRYLRRLKPHLGNLFSALPNASYGVAPLPPSLQSSMTYGYFDPANKDRDEGLYRFNAENLTKQALFTLGSLTYHELMPGHHLQYALQHENEGLHSFRRYSFVTAYNEGWAEYAATLAGEMGLYEEPEERYGRLVWDGVLTSRLVVDTGMNALGWSLERGRNYLREHGAMSDSEIPTESVRYSCDLPGQALAYKIGDRRIFALRDRVRAALGERFTLRRFHHLVLDCGAIPLTDLEWHVEHEIKSQLLAEKAG